ncbi:hypothetical protein Y032_0018g3734 [Ancylostoma ceylanicum]|uniref:Uncharacterized protein n=1 Tax=Ancylostoma ceylanicum TaxID=53326 RepID=A0A016V5Y6_9BILA|nr:hypothetical protein Y032_0018g3734 [Ancylostoma ceylanicum]
MTTILGDGIDLLISSIFSTFARGRVRTYQVGFSNTPNTNMTTILQEIIDQLVLTTFHIQTSEKRLTSSFNVVITEVTSTLNGLIFILIASISVKCSG